MGEVAVAEETGVAVDQEVYVQGAHWQVPGPRPFPTEAQAATSTETYAAGGPPHDVASSVVEEARKVLEELNARS